MTAPRYTQLRAAAQVAEIRTAQYGGRDARPPFIYALYDPREPGNIRYIGMTCTSVSRPQNHRCWAGRGVSECKTYLSKWVRKLSLEGVDYEVEVLQELCPGADWRKVGLVEMAMIAAARRHGHKLTNATDGGEGAKGVKATEVTKRAIAAANRRREWSESSRKKLSKSLKASPKMKANWRSSRGKKVSEETRAKLSAHMTPERRAEVSKWIRESLTPERRRAISEFSRSMCTPEHLEKMNAAKRGKPWSAKRRAAQTAEVTEKMRKAKLGKPAWNRGKKGIYSKEVREAMSRKNKQRYASGRYERDLDTGRFKRNE